MGHDVPHWVPTPWESIGDELESRGLGLQDLPPGIQRDAPIDAEASKKLGEFFGLSFDFWLGTQTNYDRWRVVKQLRGESPQGINSRFQ